MAEAGPPKTTTSSKKNKFRGYFDCCDSPEPFDTGKLPEPVERRLLSDPREAPALGGVFLFFVSFECDVFLESFVPCESGKTAASTTCLFTASSVAFSQY